MSDTVLVGHPALARVATRLRRRESPQIEAFAAGDWVPESLDETFSDEASGLRAAGLVEEEPGRFRSTVILWDAGGIVTALPTRWSPDADKVYLQRDSLWLLEVVWRARSGGRRAADLGAGTGFLASVLASRYQTVVAADLDPTCVAYSAANLALNRVGHRVTGAVRADRARGLRSEVFDLVTANAPWSLTPPIDDEGRPRVWADGGRRGAEIPLAFLDEVVRLLAPGGLGVLLTLDTAWSDGERPIADAAARLEACGLSVEVRPSEDLFAEGSFAALVERTPDLVAARHVAVLVERPAAGGAAS